MSDINIHKSGGEILYLIDDISTKIKDLREQYDAAQASSNAKTLIKDKEKTNKPELRKMYDDLNKKVTKFLEEFENDN